MIHFGFDEVQNVFQIDWMFQCLKGHQRNKLIILTTKKKQRLLHQDYETKLYNIILTQQI